MGSKDIRKLSRSLKTAGAQDYSLFVKGKNVEKAFKDAQEQDRYEYGSDPYSGTIGQASNYRLVTRTPMTIEEAGELGDKRVNRLDKWGYAEAIPIGETKVLGREKKLSLKVRAGNVEEARRVAKEHALTKVKQRKGAKVIVKTSWPKEIKGAGTPAFKKEPASGKGFIVLPVFSGSLDADYLWLGGARSTPIYGRKSLATAAVKEAMSEPHVGKGDTFAIVKVEPKETYKVTGTPSRLAKWEVDVTIKQVKTGKAIGFLFYGVAGT